MDELFKQYGPGMITAVAFAAIVFILFQAWNRPNSDGSVLTDIGNYVGEELGGATDYSSQADKQMFDEYATRKAPTVSVKGRVKERTSFLLVDAFTITDSDGYVFNGVTKMFESGSNSQSGVVKVLSITDRFNTEFIDDTTVYDKANGDITFPRFDTYVIKLQVLDCYNVETTVKCPLPVDMTPPDDMPPDDMPPAAP